MAAERSKGRVEGVSEAILKVLAARGIAVNDEKKREILDCRDLDRLDRWLHRAALAFLRRRNHVRSLNGFAAWQPR